MTTSMFNAKLLPTALSAAVVVVRVVVVVGRDWNNTRFQNPAGANRAGFFV